MARRNENVGLMFISNYSSRMMESDRWDPEQMMERDPPRPGADDGERERDPDPGAGGSERPRPGVDGNERGCKGHTRPQHTEGGGERERREISVRPLDH